MTQRLTATSFQLNGEKRTIMLIENLPEKSLESTLRAVFQIPNSTSIQGFTTTTVTAEGDGYEDHLISLSHVCQNPFQFKSAATFLTVCTRSDNGNEESAKSTIQQVPDDDALDQETKNGDNDSPAAGYVIKAQSASHLTTLLHTHKDGLVVVAIIKLTADSGASFSVQSTLRALSKRMPTIIFIEADVYNLMGSAHAPARGSVLPIFRFFQEGELVQEYKGGSPTSLTDATMQLARNATASIAARAALSPYPYSPAAAAAAASASSNATTTTTTTTKNNTYYPYCDDDSYYESKLVAVIPEEDIPPEYFERKGHGNHPTPQLESGQPTDFNPPVYKPLRIDIRNNEYDEDGEEEEDRYHNNNYLKMVAGNEYETTGNNDEDDYDQILGHDATDGPATLSAMDYRDLKRLLQVLITPLIHKKELSESDAQMLLERVDEKEPILLGTLLNHAENGDIAETNNILIKIVRLNEVALDYQVGLDSVGVRLAILERFYRMKALRKKELKLLRLLVGQKDEEIEHVFRSYARGAGGGGGSSTTTITRMSDSSSSSSRLNPAWLLERLVEILGEVSSEEEEEEQEQEQENDDDDDDKEEDGGDYQDHNYQVAAAGSLMYEDMEAVPPNNNNNNNNNKAYYYAAAAAADDDDDDDDDDDGDYIKNKGPSHSFDLRDVKSLLRKLVARTDVSPEEMRGIIYLVTNDPPSSLLDVLRDVRENNSTSEYEAVSLLIQAYRQMKRDLGDEDEEEEGEGEDEKEYYNYDGYNYETEYRKRDQRPAPAPGISSSSSSLASPRARTAIAAIRQHHHHHHHQETEDKHEWKSAMESLKKLILTACLETPTTQKKNVRKLYALAEAENPVIWAAFSLYRLDRNWEEFKDTLERLSISKTYGGELLYINAAKAYEKRRQVEGERGGQHKQQIMEEEEEEEEEEEANRKMTGKGKGVGSPMKTLLEERDRSVAALLVQQASCEKEIKVLRLYEKEGYLEKAEIQYLTNMVRARDPVIMAAFDVLRETHDWREMYDTMTRLLRREAAVQLVSKYQDIYQKAVFSLLSRGEIDTSGALTLMKLLEGKDEQVIDWLGEIETFYGLRGETQKIPNLMPLVRKVATMALEPAPPSFFQSDVHLRNNKH